MQRMNADIKANRHFLYISLIASCSLPLLMIFSNPSNRPTTVIDMGHEIAGAQIIQVFQGQCLPGGISLAEMEFMVPFKDLVIGVTDNLSDPYQ